MLASLQRVPRILISAFPLVFVSLLLSPILGDVARTNPSPAKARAPRLHAKQLGPDVASQGDLDAPGAVAEAEGGPFTVAEEKYLNRAWPGDEVPLDASLAAPSVFREVASRHDDDEKMDFNWQPLGPTNAFYPAILGRTRRDHSQAAARCRTRWSSAPPSLASPPLFSLASLVLFSIARRTLARRAEQFT